MLIVVKCTTCGHVLGDLWMYYKRRCEELAKDEEVKKQEAAKKKEHPNFEEFYHGKVLDELGLTKMCCRRHMLGCVELIEQI